ncbi:MAG: hypothetical protein R2867_23920 [Caldilineaceae bacterium]
MLGIVDTLMVAQLGTAAIAGVGASLQVMFFCYFGVKCGFGRQCGFGGPGSWGSIL